MYGSTQQNSRIDVGLKIHVYSLSFFSSKINDMDEIRLSITSKPDNRMQYLYFTGKQLLSPDLVFSFNITNETKEIVIIMRKKNLIEGDPIIGFVYIDSSKLPKIPRNINQLSIDKKSTDIQIISILRPIQWQYNKTIKAKKIIGEMKTQISVIPPTPNSNQLNTWNNNPLKNLIITATNTSNEPKYNSYVEYILF